jgi:hypothetical protein
VTVRRGCKSERRTERKKKGDCHNTKLTAEAYQALSNGRHSFLVPSVQVKKNMEKEKE